MSKYNNALPQLSTDLFLTDSGLETVLIFHNEIDLPDFASFPLLDALATPHSRHVATDGIDLLLNGGAIFLNLGTN
jgi:hypothetical protein